MSRHGPAGRSSAELITSRKELGGNRSSTIGSDAGRIGADLVNSDIVVIENRAIIRDCFVRSLSEVTGARVSGLMSVEDFLDGGDPRDALVVLCVNGSPTTEQAKLEIGELTKGDCSAPVIVVSDSDDIAEIVPVLRCGARGYIPTSMTLDVAVEAIRLVRAGGVFLPASSIMASAKVRTEITEAFGEARPNLQRLFTARQAAVVDALRKGKANKIIAYELSMRESTVKVHVRNIMKKLNARNRTEVAYLTTQLISDPTPARQSGG